MRAVTADSVRRQQTAVFSVCLTCSLLLLFGMPHIPLTDSADYLALLAAALLTLLGLVFVVLRRRQPAACLLGLYCVLLAVLAWDNAPAGAVPPPPHDAGLPLLPALWCFLLAGTPLLFAWTYAAPDEVALPGRANRRLLLILTAGLLAQAALLAAAQVGKGHWAALAALDPNHPSPCHRLLLAAAPTVIALHGAAVWRMARFYRGERVSRHRSVLLLLDAGMLFLLTALAADFQDTLSGYVLSDVAAYVFVVLLVYALERHALFGIRIAVRRVVQYALARHVLTAMTLGPLLGLAFYAGLTYSGGASRYPLLSPAPIFTTTMLTIAAVMLALRAPLLRWFDRTYFREVYDAQRVLNEVGRSLLGVSAPEDIAASALQGIHDVLHPGFALLLAADEGKLHCLAQRERAGFKLPPVPLDNALLELRRPCDVTAPYSVHAVSGAGQDEAVLPAALWKQLRRHDIYLLIPLRESDATTGLILLGEKVSGLPYAPEDIEILRALASQIALALQLARLNRDLLRQGTQEMTSRSAGFVELVEQERHLLAADLHDQTLPELRSLLTDLQALAANAPHSTSQATKQESAHILSFDADTRHPTPDTLSPVPNLAAMSGHLKQTISDVRDIMERLSPSALEMLGLLPAIENELRKAVVRARLPVIPLFRAQNTQLPEQITSFAQVSLFRIAQEAITNACRHANAAHLRVEVGTSGDYWEMVIEDDGAGMPPEGALNRGHGLSNMEFRAGLIGAEIGWETPQAETGTRVVVRVPLPANE